MTNKPNNAIEWLCDKIRFETDIDVLRKHAVTLLMIADVDEVEDVYQKELDEDGYYEEEE